MKSRANDVDGFTAKPDEIEARIRLRHVPRCSLCGVIHLMTAKRRAIGMCAKCQRRNPKRIYQ